jgi:hypothetical protein
VALSSLSSSSAARDKTHPIVQKALAEVGNATSRVTDGCIFIDYTPVVAASGHALPRVMLEFGARSTGELCEPGEQRDSQPNDA